jgi:hypothetical protein
MAVLYYNRDFKYVGLEPKSTLVRVLEIRSITPQMELIPAALTIESYPCNQQGRPDYQNRARNAVRLHARRIARVGTFKAQ